MSKAPQRYIGLQHLRFFHFFVDQGNKRASTVQPEDRHEILHTRYTVSILSIKTESALIANKKAYNFNPF